MSFPLDYPGFSFEVLARDPAGARLGRLSTPHGVIETPAFVFCATKGTIKSAAPLDLERAGAQVLLANTYHLFLRPGGATVEELGGLHAFTGWRGPMLTDSGGFQIFSLGHGSVADEIKGHGAAERPPTLVAIEEDGARFVSYLDGQRHLLTPELSMRVQRQLGADLVLVLDECTPFHASAAYTERALERTHRWAERCLTEFRRTHDGRQALYGIVQGGVWPELRARAAEFVSQRPFFGHAVGGSLGASKAQMYEVVEMALEGLDPTRPVHLLGIGEVDDVWANAARGVDTFDCVGPTRMARHGWALVRGLERGRINLMNARFGTDSEPIEPGCACPTCARHSRALVHHLLKSKEPQGARHLTLHNLHFMTRMMAALRDSIAGGRFEEERRRWVP